LPTYKKQLKIPVILGHEVAGTVEELGANVSCFQVGDSVMMESNYYCGMCRHCLSGNTTSCEETRIAGLEIDGGLSEYIVVPAQMLHHLPENLPFHHAVVAQPLSVVLHGILDHARVPVGEPVVVIGPGVMGNLAAQVVTALGCFPVVVVGVDADEEVRLPLAQELGFVAANYHKDNLRELLRRMGCSHGVRLVIECSGAPGTLAAGLELLDKGGQLLVLGIIDEPEPVPADQIVRREITIIGSYTSGWKNYEQALALIQSGKVTVQRLIANYPLEDGVRAIEDAIARRVVKPVLIP
jgi:L-iditol 2-dehydrogenase